MIFVSYSEKDRTLVEALVVDLGVLGQNVYFEEKSLGGSRRWDEIFERIEQADAFVYTITAHTQASYSRLLEYEHALALGKPIIPLRFEAVDVWGLPPGVPQMIDYQPQKAAVQAELARVLHSIAPTTRPVTPVVRPELSFALGQLYRRIHADDPSAAEKTILLLNLREFLERRETYTAAESMLHDFADQIGSADSLSSEVRQLSKQLQRRNKPKLFLSRGRGLKALFLLAAAGIGFWFLRNPPVAPILGDPAALTQEIVVNLPVELTAEVLVSSTRATATSTLADSPLVNTPFSATKSPSPSATRQAPSATRQAPSATPIPPMATRQQPTSTYVSPTKQPPTPTPTATRQPPSATRQAPSATPIPPTATRQPPTSTPVPPTPTRVPPTHQLPTATRQSPRATPMPPTATCQPPTPTQVPPTNQPPTHPPPTATCQPPTPTRVPPTATREQPTATRQQPTQPPPTQPPPTQAPPILIPPVVATLVPPVVATLVPVLIPNILPTQGG